MAHDVRVIIRDVKTNQLYLAVCDDDGREAYIPIDEAEVRKGDMRLQFPSHTSAVSASAKDPAR
jgi:hypothetical protein